ncbi:MAG: hypothetical protein ACNA8P_02935 [Phycisphaerales bacterium]
MANPAMFLRRVPSAMCFRFSMIPAGSLLLMGVLILGAAPLAAAQSLPPVNTERLTTGQQAQVREFVESRLRTLETADPASSEAALARRDLLEPMRNRDTGELFPRSEFEPTITYSVQGLPPGAETIRSR